MVQIATVIMLRMAVSIDDDELLEDVLASGFGFHLFTQEKVAHL